MPVDETFWEFLARTAALVHEHFLDGFLAALLLALVAPVLGCHLALRRLSLVALTAPGTAGAGQALVLFGFGRYGQASDGELTEPSRLIQLGGAALAVAVGLAALSLGRRRDVAVRAGVWFVAAVALREILLIESPYHEIFEDALHHGRLLTVVAAERRELTGVLALLSALTVLGHRGFVVSAFDEDLWRLQGGHPRFAEFAVLALVGLLSVVGAPILGPEVVLALLLIPPAILKGSVDSLSLYGPLCVLAGVLGTAASMVLAVAEDWPAGPALVLTVTGASLGVALLTSGVRRCLRR